MRNFFYAVVAISIALSGFYYSSGIYATGNNLQAKEAELPYKLIEIKPSGEEEFFSGASASEEIEGIIKDLDVVLYDEDKISVFPDPKIGIGSRIKLERAPKIVVKDGKRTKDYRSWALTVGEFLSEKGIELGVDDKTNFRQDSRIFDNSELIITRVAITQIKEKELIDFKTIKKEDSNMEKGLSRIAQKGAKGEKELTYEVRREDGEEVERRLLNSEITKQPIEEIVYIGTKVVVYGIGEASFDNTVSGMVATCNLVSKGTEIKVVNLSNGRSITVTSIGKGLTSARIIDLSPQAFQALGASLGQGIIRSVRLEKVY